jgi:hypothetical protein
MKKYLLLHPIFFTIFPILSLYNSNKDIVLLNDIFIALFLSLFLTFIVFVICFLFFKNLVKTSIATSLFLFLFFSFGHIFNNFYIPIDLGFSNLNLNYYIPLIFYIFFYLGVCALLYLSKKSFLSLVKYLFVVGLILIFFLISSISYYNINNNYKKQANLVKEQYQNEKQKSLQNIDIYYLIFDAHGRSDILAEIYNYDNSAFISALQQRGFYVANDSYSNYPQTYLSMASSLNFMYLDEVVDKVGQETDDRSILRDLLKNNKVYDILKNKGYKFVAVSDTWTGTEGNIKADIFLNKNKDLIDFNKILISTTPLNIFLDSNYNLNLFQEKILFAFNKVSKIPLINEPTFTYVHFLSPHPPFLFDHNGDLMKGSKFYDRDGSHYFEVQPDKERYKNRYIEQLSFIDKKILNMVDEIIKNSKNPPIIILQSDHGPGLMTDWENPDNTNFKERLAILNAYYVPEKMAEDLYSSVSPVNTFRILFNNLFQQNYSILEDKSYFSTWDQPYNFINVTNKLP